MELRQLQYFLAVAEELNFSRAAERLMITQPPLSLQIRNLEKEMGVPLFYRNNRYVELTDAGKVFYKEIQVILHSLERAMEHARRTHNGEIGKLRVGFVGSATYDILPSVLKKFRSLYPGIEVTLSEMSTPVQVEALRGEEIDVGVLRPPVSDSSLITQIVSEAPCVLAVPKEHPLTAKKNIVISDLQTYPFVMLSSKTWEGLYKDISDLCHPTILQEALEFQTVISLVAAGIGIAVVPQSAMKLHTGGVEYVTVMDGHLPKASMGVSWRKNDQSSLVRCFVNIAEELSSIGDEKQ